MRWQRTPGWSSARLRVYLGQDALSVELRERLGRAPSAEERQSPSPEALIAADRTVLREQHADQALDLASIAWPSPDGPRYLLEDNDLRHAFSHLAGRLAASHWWSVPELRRLAGTHIAVGALPHEWEVDALKFACLLRLADASHLDSRRAPALRRWVQAPSGESLLHWAAQDRLARPLPSR